MKSTFKNGYSLVEVLVAISILLLALVGPMTIAAKGLQSAYYARQQATALFLAQEGIEIVVASRNDALIKAIQAGTPLDSVWKTWKDADIFKECFKVAGCNFALTDAGDGTLEKLFSEDRFTVQRCNSGDDCLLRFNKNATRARFNLTSGSDTEYTRVIKLTEEANRDGNSDNDGVFIEVTVSWPASVFGGETQSVVLTSAVYSIYE